MAATDRFQCHTCGKWHDGPPLDFAYDSPHYWSESLRSDPGCFLNSDLCVVKNEDFFVRGVIEVPILESREPFRWGVWVSLSKNNFDRMIELSHNLKLLDEPPYFGWLSNSIEAYPQTLNLKTNVHWRNLRHRPYVLLELSDHPLAVEQRDGMTMDRVRQIAEKIMHSK